MRSWETEAAVGGMMMQMVVKTTRVADGGYRAWCPALPGCVVWGASDEEALCRLEDAARGYLSSLNVALPKDLFPAHQGAAYVGSGTLV